LIEIGSAEQLLSVAVNMPLVDRLSSDTTTIKKGTAWDGTLRKIGMAK
jgi:hypothetical protein